MVICCSICQERLDRVSPDNVDLKACAITCGHTFHFGCIKQWWIKQYEVPGPEFIQGVRCPICRHTNMPLLVEINFLFKDDDLFCRESEMNESIILQQNIEEIMEECKQIKKNIQNIRTDMYNELRTKLNLLEERNKMMKETHDLQALIRKKIQSSFTKQTSSVVSKDKVKVPVSSLINESTRDSYIQKFIRIPQMSGTLYDDIEEEEKEHEKNRLRKAIEEGVDWILIELCEFQIEPRKLMADAHHVHIFGSIASVCSIVSCYIWPQYRWTYIPFTIVSTIGAVYFNSSNYRLVSQYEVEQVELIRFPMKTLLKNTIVLRKKGNAKNIRICNFLTAGIAFLYTCYNL